MTTIIIWMSISNANDLNDHAPWRVPLLYHFSESGMMLYQIDAFVTGILLTPPAIFYSGQRLTDIVSVPGMDNHAPWRLLFCAIAVSFQ